jgi:hypothetical protein
MAYLNKAKIELIRKLALTMKVKAKQTSTERERNGASTAWHRLWDEAEYAHAALLALTGSKVDLEMLQAAAKVNGSARDALARIEGFIV